VAALGVKAVDGVTVVEVAVEDRGALAFDAARLGCGLPGWAKQAIVVRSRRRKSVGLMS